MKQEETDEDQIKAFKVKRLIKKLDSARGEGTSMISVIIGPNKKIADFQKQLLDQYGNAENIKDRVNRQSVQAAITSAKEKLKTYTRIPKNGLLIYCGTVMTDDGKSTKKIVIDVEPHKPINMTNYHCGNHFITEPLKELLESDEKYGFIIVDGNGTMWATLQGNHRNVVSKFSVDLPKKHGRGGQSSNRFANIRDEKRNAYVKKVCETTTSCFITDDRPNVSGIVIAGYADFKTQVSESQFLDPRLKKVVCNVVDISYGMDQGLNQAIELSKGVLKDIKLVQEQQVIGKFFETINIDHEKIIYSIKDTMRALEDGVVQKLLVYDDLDFWRVLLRKKADADNEDDEANIIKYLTTAGLEDPNAFIDPETKEELVEIEREEFVDWIAQNHSQFGCEIVMVTDRSPEGSQFVNGFGGVGGFLRYKVDYDMDYDAANNSDDDDEFFI